MDSSIETKSKFIKLFEIRRIIDNDTVSSNNVWTKLVDCLDERKLKTVLLAGIGHLANNHNHAEQSSHVIDKISVTLSALEDEKKKQSAIHNNAISKVFCIDALHFKINEYLDFKSLMRLCRVNCEWLYNAYKPQSQYKFNTRQCHAEYIPPTNDAEEPHPHHYLSILRKRLKTNENEEGLENIVTGRCSQINDHHIPGLEGGRGIYNILRFSQSKILVIHKWHSISNKFYSNLMHFNKIQQLDIRYFPRYDRYIYNKEHLMEAKKMNGWVNENNNVGFYGTLSMIMEKNFDNLSRLTFYQSLSIDLDAWKLFFNDKRVNFSNIKYLSFEDTTGFWCENEKFKQRDKLEIKDKIIPKMAHQLANNLRELKIDSHNSGRKDVYWVAYFLSELLSHVTKNKEYKNKNLKYVSVNTGAGYGFDKSDIKPCKFAFKDSKNLLKCMSIKLDGNMNDNEIDNVTKMFMANDLKSKRSDEFGIICQELIISSIYGATQAMGDFNALVCKTIVKLLKRMNNINSQCLNKNGALKGLKKLSIGKFMHEDDMIDLFELFDEIDKLPTSLKEIKVEIGQTKIGYYTGPNIYDMDDMVPTLEDLTRVCDILQKWSLIENQLKKCVIEFGALFRNFEDFNGFRLNLTDFDTSGTFDFSHAATKWFHFVGDEVLVEKLGFIELGNKVDNERGASQDMAPTHHVPAWYTNSSKYNQIKANIKSFVTPKHRICLRLSNF